MTKSTGMLMWRGEIFAGFHPHPKTHRYLRIKREKNQPLPDKNFLVGCPVENGQP